MTLSNQDNKDQPYKTRCYLKLLNRKRERWLIFVATHTVTPTSGNSVTTTFTWNTTGFAYANYTMKAVVSTLPYEMDIDDNRFIDGWTVVTIPGDVNGDFKVKLTDLVILDKAYGSRPSELEWSPNADIDGNNLVGLTIQLF